MNQKEMIITKKEGNYLQQLRYTYQKKQTTQKKTTKQPPKEFIL